MTLAKVMGSPGKRVRTLGKGDEAVRYIKLPDGGAAARMIGGGFLSATRVGPYFVLGLNPRTTRSLVRAVAKSDTLLTRDGFAERFPRGRGRTIQGFFDFKAAVTTGFARSSMLLMMFWDGFRRNGKMLPIPSPSDIAPWLGVEFLESEKTDFGHVLHVEGGTMLSLVAWAGVMCATSYVDFLQRLAQ